jgi:transcriptional regulator with XRE-family HTH domain
MESRHVSREQLGERAEMSKPRIERLLAGESEPTARDLLRLASAVEASVAELLEVPDA